MGRAFRFSGFWACRKSSMTVSPLGACRAGDRPGDDPASVRMDVSPPANAIAETLGDPTLLNAASRPSGVAADAAVALPARVAELGGVLSTRVADDGAGDCAAAWRSGVANVIGLAALGVAVRFSGDAATLGDPATAAFFPGEAASWAVRRVLRAGAASASGAASAGWAAGSGSAGGPRRRGRLAGSAAGAGSGCSMASGALRCRVVRGAGSTTASAGLARRVDRVAMVSRL